MIVKVANPTGLAVLTNPRKRTKKGANSVMRKRKAGRPKAKTTRRKNPFPARTSKRVVVRKRRNPAVASLGSPKTALMTVLSGAGGFLVANLASGYITPKLPGSIPSGYANTGIQALAAVLFMKYGRKIFGSQVANAMGIGAGVAATMSLIKSLNLNIPGLNGLLGNTGAIYQVDNGTPVYSLSAAVGDLPSSTRDKALAVARGY